MTQEFGFERYTQPATLTLFHARAVLSEHAGTAVLDAHLLLGILKTAPELGPLGRSSVGRSTGSLPICAARLATCALSRFRRG